MRPRSGRIYPKNRSLPYFTSMEGELILAALSSRWRMRLLPGQKVDIRPRITLRAKQEMSRRSI